MRKVENGDSIRALQRRIAELEQQQKSVLTKMRQSPFNSAPVADQTKPDPSRTGEDNLDSTKAIARGHEDPEAAAVTRYHERAGHGRVSADLVTVVRASYEGRVEELFVADEAERWGTFEPGSGTVTVRDKPGPVGEDLINLAAIQAFQRGGAIHVLERSHLPGAADVAAIFRY